MKSTHGLIVHFVLVSIRSKTMVSVQTLKEETVIPTKATRYSVGHFYGVNY